MDNLKKICQRNQLIESCVQYSKMFLWWHSDDKRAEVTLKKARIAESHSIDFNFVTKTGEPEQVEVDK